jgi:hypothetical protein
MNEHIEATIKALRQAANRWNLLAQQLEAFPPPLSEEFPPPLPPATVPRGTRTVPGETVKKFLNGGRRDDAAGETPAPRKQTARKARARNGLPYSRATDWERVAKLPEPFSIDALGLEGTERRGMNDMLRYAATNGYLAVVTPGRPAHPATYKRTAKFQQLLPGEMTEKEKAYAEFRRKITVPRDADVNGS